MTRFAASRSLVALVISIAFSAPAVGASAATRAPVTAAPAMLFVGETPESMVTRVVGIRIQNITAAAIKGSLRVVPEQAPHDSRIHSPMRVPVSLGASEEATVRVPLPPTNGSVYRYDVLFETDSDTFSLTKFDHTHGYNQFTLLDLSQPPRLVQLRGSALPGYPSSSPSRAYGAPQVAVATASVVAGSGDIALPEQPSAYATIGVVFARSEQLAHIPQAAQNALLAWVHAGGTLAVAVSRPEDLRLGPLPQLVGGEIVATPVSNEVLSPRGKRPKLAPPSSEEGAPEVEETTPVFPDAGVAPSEPDAAPDAGPDADELENTQDSATVPIGFAPQATPVKKKVPGPKTLTPPWKSTPKRSAASTAPSEALKASLLGYKSPNLEASRFGATAHVGLGYVHLLAFDPAAPGVLDEPWTKVRMLELLEDATRDTKVLDGPLTRPWHENTISAVRKLLDPNEGFRPALLVSTLLLIGYSIVVGPVALLWARRRRRLFDALALVPLLSGATFFTIVAVSFISRGAQSRARRFSLVEIASGDEHGAIRRYRGFFSSRSSNLAIAAGSPSAMIALANDDVIGGGELRRERDGLVLSGVPTAAWQTLVVREDDAFRLKGGVRLRLESDNSITIENNTEFKLVDVLVSAGATNMVYFESIAAHGGASSKTGQLITHGTAGFETYLACAPPSRRNDIVERWHAMSATSRGSMPVAVRNRLVLSGELAGADAPERDSGLRVDKTHTLVRVVSPEGG